MYFKYNGNLFQFLTLHYLKKQSPMLVLNVGKRKLAALALVLNASHLKLLLRCVGCQVGLGKLQG